MKLYLYKGPVLEFDKCIANTWEGRTYAVSPSKARCNLAYQFKQQTNRIARTRISLPGKLTAVDEKEELR